MNDVTSDHHSDNAGHDQERILLGLTGLAANGLECVVCNRLAADDNPMQPVGRSENGVQVFACAGGCAEEIGRQQRG